MKKLLIVVAGLAVFAASEAQAAQRYYYRPVYNTGYRTTTRTSGGPLSNLMDLERRKNAWLRQTFMGY